MIIQGQLLIDAHEPPTPGWIAVENDRIAELGEGSPPDKADLGDSSALISPGFIDAHLHVPQIDVMGFDGLELMEWLEQVVYPAETRWADATVASRQIRRAYRRMLNAGTLGYAGFLTSHEHGLDEVMRASGESPLRAIVGQALMDQNAPEELLGQGIGPITRSPDSRVFASVNPRYAVACSEQLLDEACTNAKANNAFIQTHLAESRCELAKVRALFPDDANYTAVYDRHGLLTPRTLLAHCVHLNDEEWRLIAKRNAVVVHCPTANTFLKSGVFNLDKAHEHQVRVALGSDIAAGPDIAMPRVARAMIETAKFRAMSGDESAQIPSPAAAWHLITRGNADALGWSDAGRIEVGAAADLLLLRLPFDVDEHLIGRLIYTWRDELIAHRIVAGRAISRLNV